MLGTCVVLPEHERRGAGGMLVRWGCERADEEGVEVYVEASLVGVPLYERMGFVVVKRVKLDMGRFEAGDHAEFVVSFALFLGVW